MLKEKEYYIGKYNNLLESAKKDSLENGWDYSETACEYEADANTNEVVGYYLFNEKENAFNAWLKNTEHIKSPSKQDIDVTAILKQLCNNNPKEASI